MDTRQGLFVKFSIILLLLILQNDRRACDALHLKCPMYQMHLQKVVGFRPPLDYITERNRIYAPELNRPNRVARNRYTTELANEEVPIASRICWRICSEDDKCIAYVHLLDTDECYGFSYLERTHRYHTIGEEVQMVADPEAIYFEKTCLKVPETCKSRLWSLTKIPGTTLMFQGKKTISTLVTRRECSEKCLFESEFKCLSASFVPSYRNNRERFGQLMAPRDRGEILGGCILSHKDKMVQSDAFRAAPFDEEYIENQCVERAAENDSCSFELYSNSNFIYAEAKYTGLTQKECQSYCSKESTFYCLGVTFSNHEDDDNMSRSQCSLHSEDIISMGPRSLKLKANSVYMRRVKCLDGELLYVDDPDHCSFYPLTVQVECSNEQMTIKYTPKDWFRGRMYVSAHSEDCVVAGNGTSSTLLRLPIGSEAKENRCGIVRAYEVTKKYQRIFISALIVIQNNANVQTQGDRLIKVGCIMTKSNSDQDDADSEEDIQNVPNAIALESSLEFSHQSLPNEGTVLYNISEPQLVPEISLQIIDLSHQRQTNDVQIGQNLELQIVAQSPLHLELATSTLYDIRASSLLAKTQDSQSYVLLIDGSGCPTDVTVFPGLERVRSKTKNMLRARFHAFKFAGSALVGFDVKIHFCAHRCPEMNCLSNTAEVGETVDKKWSRQRRQTSLQDQQLARVKIPVYISNVMDQPHAGQPTSETPKHVFHYSSEKMNHEDFALPLNLTLRVRGPDVPDSNSFIYGERGILLIAGIDDQLHSGGIYINESLLIALFIFWLCIQTALMFGCCYVIQKYKRLASLEDERRKIYESLEYDGRRVRWADSQGGYTV